jgi:monoamine oxidase
LVAVIGAGLAGCTAAYRLHQTGVDVQLFESRDRVGGRCWTARGFADGQTAEHGGEFIDTRHVHLRHLAAELHLKLDDLWEGWLPGFTWLTYVDGKLGAYHDWKERQQPIVDAAKTSAKEIGVLQGNDASTAAYTFGTATPQAVTMDQMSMAEWLDLNAPGITGSPFGSFLDEVMASWYGLNMSGLSALNWIDFYVIPWPGADERWHIRGGNDQVPNRIADALPAGTLHLGSPLESLRKRGDGRYDLSFDGTSKPLVADYVILTAPFTALRNVDLSDSGFSQQRLGAIMDFGLGTDVKLLLQYDRRPNTWTTPVGIWSGGMEHADAQFETWESSVDEPGNAGLITVYAGGRGSTQFSASNPHGEPPAEMVTRTLGYIDDAVPGTATRYNGRAWLDDWTSDPWTGGSYAAFGPGQMTKYWGYTARPEGRVHFAGEHTSTYSQGFLNGGVESGQRAAIEVMGALGLPVPKAIASLPYSTYS